MNTSKQKKAPKTDEEVIRENRRWQPLETIASILGKPVDAVRATSQRMNRRASLLALERKLYHKPYRVTPWQRRHIKVLRQRLGKG